MSKPGVEQTLSARTGCVVNGSMGIPFATPRARNREATRNAAVSR